MTFRTFTVLCIAIVTMNSSHAGTLVEQENSQSLKKASAQVSLTVDIKRLHSNKGKIIALLFQNKEGFPNDAVNAHRRGTATITNLSSQIVFQNLQPGNYAIALFHDENSDSILNKHWYGKPIEGVATSNNVFHRFSAPDYDESQFKLKENLKIDITMHYFD